MTEEPHFSTLTHGRLLVLAAALLWSTSGVIVKSPALENMLPVADRGATIACYRALFAALCLMPLVRRRNIRFRPLLVPLVISFASMNVMFIMALTRTTAAAAIFLQYTSTMWAFVIGVVLLKERLDRGNLVALAFGLSGIGWIVMADWSGERMLGTLLGLGSGLAYAGVIVSLRLLHEEDSVWLIALCHVISCAVIVPWVIWRGLVPGAPQWGMIAMLGVVQMAIPYVLFAKGLKYVQVQEAALIPLLEPICNPLWVWLTWGEQVPWATIVGGGLILVGLVLRYLMFFPHMRNTTAAANMAQGTTGNQ